MRATENLGAFCISEDKKEMMRFLDCDEKYYKEKCSDFEFLAEWERILPYCAGSESARLYEKQLSLLGFSEILKNEIRPSSVELWQMANESLTEENKLNFIRKYEKMIEKQGIDVFDYVMNIVREKKTDVSEISFPSEEILQDLLFECKEAPQLRLEVSSLCYARPDRYHATLAWQRFFCGEKLNDQETFLLRFQWLIELLLLLKQKKTKAVVHLISSDRALCSQTISYLKENRLMEGEIRFSLFLEEDVSSWLPLCRMSDERIRIVPALALRPTDLGAPLAPALRSIATVYPIGGLRFGEVLTDSESLALVAKEEAYERIDEFLSSEKICDEKRQEILSHIFDR